MLLIVKILGYTRFILSFALHRWSSSSLFRS